MMTTGSVVARASVARHGVRAALIATVSLVMLIVVILGGIVSWPARPATAFAPSSVAIADIPADYLVLYQRAAVAFWGAGRQVEAVKATRIASDLDPANNLYYGLLELFLTKMGMAEEAALEQPRAAKMDDYDREALRRMGIEAGLEPFLG